MATRYSSKAQERFFRPVRIKVLVWGDRNHIRYVVIKYNVVTRKIVETFITSSWRKPLEYGMWIPEGKDYPTTKRYTHNLTGKGVAISIAKAEAVRLKLPFNLKTDFESRLNLKKGPLVSCLCCGKVAKRSFEQFVCDGCKTDWQVAQAARLELTPYSIGARNLLPLRLSDFKKANQSVLFRLCWRWVGW